MQWDRRQVIGMSAFGGVLALLAIGLSLRSGSGGSEPVSIAPVPVATPAPPMTLLAEGPVVTPPVSPSPTPTAAASPSAPRVFVSGEVKRAGVYRLKPGDRIQEAIEAAGGFTANARTDVLNLADYVRDADQYHVPAREPVRRPARSASSETRAVRRGSAHSPSASPSSPKPGRVLGKGATVAGDSANPERPAEPSSESEPGGGSGSAKFRNPGDGTVNLNTAGLSELQRLPGVGPSTAQRILEYRQQIGSFADVSQIKDVKGIGPKKYEKMQPFLAVR
ncbi:MAG: helix-hairpin-helix domain-containing protein [Capsulimonadales bacterium]|nr:helix-hairpin-helix domain-containing protein [Capsulimonadales bacterium]